jgi:DNA repair protein RecN (Recombination protein N)
MILELSIKNFILIEDLNISFKKGLTVFTGETGAGKSIILEAINVALGKKSKQEYLKDESKKAIIELVFSFDEKLISKVPEELRFILDEELIVITREIYGNGKSLSKLNGNIISLSSLRELTTYLIDIHGQHMHQSLLDSKGHIEYIDNSNPLIKTKLEELKVKINQIKETKIKIDEIKKSFMTKSEQEFLEFQLKEIEKLKINLENDSLVEERYSIIKNSERIKSNLNASIEMFNSENGIIDLLVRSKHKFMSIVSFSPKFYEIENRIENALIDIIDLNEEISTQFHELSFDEEEFLQLETRLDELNYIKAKYSMNLEELLEFVESSTDKLINNNRISSLVDEQEKLLQILIEEYKYLSQVISELRINSFNELSIEVLNNIVDLNLKEAKLECEFEKINGINEFGNDKATFLFSANINKKPAPLNDVASGGEISRIMLGLKLASSKFDIIDTLIFDEIDSGISGETAIKVGRKLKELSKNKQVILITHLPSIAAFSNNHYKILKSNGNTDVIELKDEEKLQEITRIISGDNFSQIDLVSTKKLVEKLNDY